jgi:hypothetical protein
LRGGENMKKFKAVVTFAYLENVYYKDDEVYEAPAELVEQWAEVGYVETLGEKREEVTQGEKVEQPAEVEEKPKKPVKKKGAAK